MIRGGLAGKGARGGRGAIDSLGDGIGTPNEYWRRAAGTYLWAMSKGGANSSQNSTLLNSATNGHDMLRAYPQVFPRKGTIGSIGWFNPIVYAGLPNAGAIRFGIYAHNDSAFRPAELLFDSGSFLTWPDPSGVPSDKWRQVVAGLSVRADTLLWVAWFYNDGIRADSQRIYTWAATETTTLMGFLDPETLHSPDTQYRLPDSTGKIVGLRHAQAFGAMPSSFPTTSIIPICESNSLLEPTTLSGQIPAFAYAWANA